VRIFTVGLHSAAFNPATLKALAAGSGGEFAEASSSAQLAPIYSALSARLANQYVIRYQSLLGPDVPAHVRVQVEGVPGAATATYSTPSLPVHASPEYRPPVVTTFFGSVGGMLLVVLLAAGLIGGAIALVLRPRQRTVRARVGEFVTVKGPEGDERERFALRVFGGVERPLENVGRWAKFKDNLEIAGIEMPAIQIVLWTLTATLVVAFLIDAATGSPILPLIAFVIPVAVYESISRRLKKVRKAFAEQLPDNLQVLASALRAGHSFVGALAVVVDDCEEPSRSELRRVVADEQLGVPLEDALDSVVRRMDNRDLGQVALVASLQRQTGGNSAEVIDRVTDTVRERFELRRLVQTLTAQGRMSRWIVSGLPVVLLLAFLIISPAYLAPLFHHAVGQALLALAFVLVVIGSIVIGRIVDIEV
jgi:tight adherence protein B